MADVKWIKVYTNMISNKKIKKIRRFPEGNNIILIWVFLLAQAGESNKDGGLFITETMPFTVEDLADEFDFKPDIIRLALGVLENFNMVETFEDVIYIKNWQEYQNIEGLDKIREQTRKRVARHRDKTKLIGDCNVTCSVISNGEVTQGNATEEEIDKEIDKDIYIIQTEDLWNLYPNKKGKGNAIKKIPKHLKKYGYEQMTRTIERYIKDVEQRRLTGFKDLQFKNGSTFFHEGFIDYLDENYVQPKQTIQEPSKSVYAGYKEF